MERNSGKNKSLSVLYTNTDQFINKRDDMCMLIAGREPDIILLTEVIPKAQVNPISPSLLAIPHYTMYLNFNPSHANLGASGIRGICVFVNEKMHATEVSFQDFPFKEQLWLQMSLSGPDRLLIGCIYRSPSGDSEAGTEMLIDLMRHACNSGHSHVLITGDFNMPQIDWTLELSSAPVGHVTHKFLEACRDCFLIQHVHKPTRYRQGVIPSTLDLLFSNEEGMVQNLAYLPGLAKSDHIVLSFDLACYTAASESVTPHYNLHKADFPRLNELIRGVHWEDQVEKTVQDRYDYLKGTLVELCDTCIPKTVPKTRKKNLYITQEAMSLRGRKNKLWWKYVSSRDPIDYARFVRARNDLRRLSRKLRRNFEQRLAADLKHDVKPFWRYANTRLRTRSRVEDLRNADGSLSSGNQEKAETLNTFFSSVFTAETVPLPDPGYNFIGAILEHVDITAEMVELKLCNLRPSSSPGPDRLHPRVLRETAQSLARPMSQLFRESLETGVLPDDWRLGEVVPIFKKGDKQCPANYRPVSLTAVPCKVMESVVRDALVDHMVSTQQLHNAQHGFRQKRSCVTQLLETIEDWSRALEAGDPLDAIYCDFSKAFDSVPHQRLLRKLHAYGVRGRLLHWIESFLTGRKQRVVVNGVQSSWAPVTSGVPQGSVLGPVLFIIFVNDLPDAVQCSVKLFADDTKLYRSMRLAQDTQLLQRDLDAIVGWSEVWQLPFNARKCKTLHMGRNNDHHTYTMSGAELEVTEVERDLGVQIDGDLKFREQAAAAVSKASQILGVIRRSFEYLNTKTLPLLFKTLVQPHLEYANSVWGPFNRADEKRVERVQRRATRLIPDLRELPYQERLRKLDLPSLYYRRSRGDMITVYQLLHGGLDVDSEQFLRLAGPGPTRGHPWKLEKPRAVSRARRCAFSTRVVNPWNALPTSVVTAASLNQFKSRLDSHWTHNKYNTHTND